MLHDVREVRRKEGIVLQAAPCEKSVSCRGDAPKKSMDEIVRRALAKWPNVPSVYNWLGLDRRGNWLVKGGRISNPAVVDFIARNYDHDAQGRWYFQNGPQRVFVNLAYTPFIYRVESDAQARLMFRTHTGSTYAPRAAWMDESGDVLVDTDGGIGLLDDRDLGYIVERLTISGRAVDDAALEVVLSQAATTDLELRVGAERLRVGRIRSGDVPARFGFDPQPRPAPGEPEC